MKTRASQPQRGSVLIVAMIFAAIIAVALTSYMKMAGNALELSKRSFWSNDSMNLTEAGIEQALWAFNQKNAGNTAAWDDWTTVSGTTNEKIRTFTGFNLSQNASGSVTVWVRDYNSTGTPQPLVVSKATIMPTTGNKAPIVKEVEVFLIRRSLFATGMVGKNGISFSGSNASVDSWNSDPGNDGTDIIAYSTATGVRRDAGTIATVTVTSSNAVMNADIYGYASVGGTSTAQISLGPQGLVGPFGTSAGYKDPSRVAANFTQNLPNATNPEIPSGYTPETITSITTARTFPETGDTAASDGVYYYYVGSISMSGNDTNILRISDNKKVVMIVTAGAGTTGVSLAGQSKLAIDSGSSLALYTASNVALGGGGVANANAQPIGFSVWGTGTSTGQTISISGSGELSAVVYAPNAGVTIVGNGDVKGAVVGNTVAVTGNAKFHYDESLANYGGNNPFKISKWRELVSESHRNLFSSKL